jgi:hypothetical protein
VTGNSIEEVLSVADTSSLKPDVVLALGHVKEVQLSLALYRLSTVSTELPAVVTFAVPLALALK